MLSGVDRHGLAQRLDEWAGRLEVQSRNLPGHVVGASRREQEVMFLRSAAAELRALDCLINTPELEDFHRGVDLEAAHQVERFGSDHDAGKSPLDWFWLIGFLAQKAAFSAIAGDLDKARHHCISTAAGMLNWHRALSGRDTTMRPGIETPAGEVGA